MDRSERIVVVGCGAIGLPIAVALAVVGFQVVGYDVDRKKVARLRDGAAEIREPDLAAAYAETMASARIRFVDVLDRNPRSTCFVICVDTPATESGFDRRNFDAAIAAVAAHAQPGDAVLIRSTVVIGTTRSVARRFAEQKLAVDVACCPDRTLGGRSYAELFEIPAIVAGVDERAASRAAAVFGRIGKVVRLSDPQAAEAVKLFTNVHRDTLFGLANEFALICERLGLDMYEIVAAAAQGYPRAGLARPGPVGGPCLTKDTALLAAALPDGDAARIALSARAVNSSMVDHASDVVLAHVPPGLIRPAIAIIGVAYKGRPATHDTRGSFAIALARRLARVLPRAELRAWDPEVSQEAIAACGFIPCADAMSAAVEASAVIFTTDHAEIAALDPAPMADLMRKPALLYDLCGVQRSRAAVARPGVTVRVHGVGVANACTEATQQAAVPLRGGRVRPRVASQAPE